MDRTNYCADCEQHACEAATLRAQLAAKDEEIAGLKSNALRRRLEIEDLQRIAALEAENAGWREDRDRLDWCHENTITFLDCVHGWDEGGTADQRTIRTAIDDAREGEIEEYKGLLSSEECDTTFWKERCEAKDKTFDEMTDRFVEEKDAAEARVRELEDLLNEANKLIMEHCDQGDRIAALESELAEARELNDDFMTDRRQLKIDLAEAKKGTARLVAAADEVLSLFSSPRPLPDSAVYMCGAEAGVRTLEALRAAIDDASKAD